MASWGHCLGATGEAREPCLLELKALYVRAPGRWASFMVFSQHLVMQVTLELHTLLKVALKAHPELQAMLIDVQQYKPTVDCEGVHQLHPRSWTSQAAPLGQVGG